ncbi:hypothetical protein [Lysinibacter sp. HNR]|uniref:hypothetical protein n=1 Tax=Lysinibacter sp. HNR TaxID=3031408 RepID=UPI0024349B09|nr:hypothetical protein [Lysinibacter sp. HNR]WGD37918.1 hypothetical protein FrondiHNR_03110 [Lysinibacter sp. HNR]
MTRRKPLLRFALLAALIVTVPLGITYTPHSSAAYTDRATAITPSTSPNALRTAGSGFKATNTYIANTGMSIQTDGTLWVWGFRENGLSGTGVASVPGTAPPSRVILPNDGYTGPGGQRRIIKVAGVSHDNFFPSNFDMTGIAALSHDGIVYTWGGNQVNNVMGRPGTGATFFTPGRVNIPTGDGTVVDLISTAGVFIALTQNGAVYTWGWAQDHGITGQGTPTASSPTPQRILQGAHSIGSGTWNGWAVMGNNNVVWWGRANDGYSFAGSPSGDNVVGIVFSPQRSNTLSTYAQSGCNNPGTVAGSPQDTCTIQTLTGHSFGNQMFLNTGQVITWGNGSQQGTGRASNTPVANNTPTPLALPGNVRIQKFAATQEYVLLLGTNNSLYIYGRYSFAGGPDPWTGAMSRTNLQTPTQIVALGATVTDIGGFGYTGMALTTDGHMRLWGGSTSGSNTNTHSSVRNNWGVSTTPLAPSQPITLLRLPGVDS